MPVIFAYFPFLLSTTSSSCLAKESFNTTRNDEIHAHRINISFQWTFIEVLSSNPYFGRNYSRFNVHLYLFSIHILKFDAQISVIDFNNNNGYTNRSGWPTCVHIKRTWLELLLTIQFIYLFGYIIVYSSHFFQLLVWITVTTLEKQYVR